MSSIDPGRERADNDKKDEEAMKQNPVLKMLSSQVGGHHYDAQVHKKARVGMYDVGNGSVLKTLQPAPRGLRELNFYREVFNPDCKDEDFLELRQFMPTFYGTEEIGNSTFLKLANLTAAFRKPCVADLKMGRVTYDKDASPEKKRTEDAKFPPAKELGYKIIGIMIHENDQLVHHGKPFCRNLTKDNIISKGLACFFSLLGDHKRREVILQLIARLRKIESWFLRQKKISFIGASLLIVYEGFDGGERHNESRPNNELNNHSTTSNKDLPTNQPVERIETMSSHLPSKCSESSNSNKPSSNCQQGTASPQSSAESLKNAKRPCENENLENGDDLKRRRSDILSDSQKFTELSELSLPITAHLIDFAHTFPADDIDHNVLFGVQKLIVGLEEWLESIRPGKI